MWMGMPEERFFLRLFLKGGEAMFDCIVVGGGHAGCEAALAAARLHHRTLLVTGNLNKVASMPCNPSIGGPAKGTLVREIDALGGEMGKNTDQTALQMKMLNSSKGPAVRALRAQSDKVLYSQTMLKTLKNQQNLECREAFVNRLMVDNQTVTGVILESGEALMGQTVIITTGTFMEGAILIGNTKTPSGPENERPSIGLSAHLRELGIPTFRLKTGTPQRLKRDSIDFSKMTLSPGDGFIHRFSHDPDYLRVLDEEWPCYLIHTVPKTHEIIQEHLLESALYSGLVEGVGPRYCPSIEDKLVRFSDKPRHQLFIEPESASLDEVYLQGFSTSMPKAVQDQMVASLPGLEKAIITKYAYAIEYDAIHATMLKPSLESLVVRNLYFAGQVNGTSGYEEAAAQGLIAGINASRKIEQKPPLVLRRDQAYIGVLIDDLVTKETKEPYRMLTSRAEFRLLLRHDNADSRLMEIGHDIGLLDKGMYQRFLEKKATILKCYEQLNQTFITPTDVINEQFIQKGLAPLRNKMTLAELFKRPDFTAHIAKQLFLELNHIADEVMEEIEIEIKYQGYIAKAIKEAEHFQKNEAIQIPEDIDYHALNNLALEARQKLARIRPASIGQAARISGVNPADIQMLLIALKQRRSK